MLSRFNGFTLVEVMVATTIGLGLLLVIFTFLAQALRMSEIMISHVQLNAEARLDFDLLGNGGVIGGVDVPGLRGSGDVVDSELRPSLGKIGRLAQKLVIDAGATGLLESTELNVPITCDDVGTPHPDCLAAGTETVSGYLASAPIVDDTVRNLTVTAHCGGGPRPATAEVALDLIDPHLLGLNDDFIAEQYRAEYHNVLALHVDCL